MAFLYYISKEFNVIPPTGYSDVDPLFANFKTTPWVNQLYVDPAIGNDSNLGTLQSPKATIKAAVTAASNNTTIWLKGDTVHIADNNQNNATWGGGYVSDNAKSIAFVGVPGTTTVDTSTTSQYIHSLWLGNVDSIATGILFKMDTGTRTTSYTVSWLSRDTDNAFIGTVRNCVFHSYRANQTASYASLQYNNSNTDAVKVYNCTFLSDYIVDSYSGANANGVYNYCSFGHPSNPGVVSFLNLATHTGSNLSDTITNGYHCTSDATIGVYSGTYAWK